MRNVERYLLQIEATRKRIKKIVSALMLLSLFVVVSVFWNLRLTGITIANSAMCGEEEHMHVEECISDQVLICEEIEDDLNAQHEHTDDCYQFIYNCDYEEHIHDLSCYSDTSADVETAEIWEATLPELSDDKVNNLIQIALSQVGYVESDDNFLVKDDIRNGITRYGQWYGNPYGDWSNMFTSFCLTYSGLDVPMNSGAEAMRLEWLDKDIYRPLGNYEPVAGDVLYLDKDQNGTADTTAIIISNDETTLHVVEGDVEGKVVETIYDLHGGLVMGYGVTLPETKVLMTNPIIPNDTTINLDDDFILNSNDESSVILDNESSEDFDNVAAIDLDNAYTIANTVTYSSSIFTNNSKFVIYTITTDNRYYAIDGNGNAVEIYIDSSGNIKSDISDPDLLYWTITSSTEKYDNQSTYFIQNAATGYYLHPYSNNNGHGAVMNEKWVSAFYSNNNGVRFRGIRQNAYAYLSGTTFTNIAERNSASTFYFGKIESCTIWLDGTNGDVMNSKGSTNQKYTVIKGGTITLPQEWTTPSKYYYTLNGWVDIQTGNYYRPGEEMVVTGNTVLYADWVAKTYDIGVYNSHVVDTVSTNDFITTKVFDYNSLFNMLSSKVNVNISDSSHSETWSHVQDGTVTYKGQTTLNFSFNDHDSSGKITNLSNLNAPNKYTGGGTYPGIYNKELSDALFDEKTAFNSETGEGLIGKHYLGEGDHLFQYETDPTDEYYGYYYYDAKKNASSYNQSAQRFYVYDYLERNSDSAKENNGAKYSDFAPLNSPYANNPGRNVATYNYGGDNGEYTDVVHYQYDSRYNENGSNENNMITNFWFGMSVEIDFYLPNVPGTQVDGEYGNKDIYGNDMHFLFAGDDDVWVVLDDERVILDIGGIHGVEGGEINFSTGTVTVGNKTETLKDIKAGKHKITIYYVERGSSMSNCAIYFNLAPQYSLTLQKEDVFTQESLDGAKFAIYTDPSCEEKYLAELWNSKESYLRDDESPEYFEVKNGKVSIWGFGASNTYYIKEISPPTNGGYSTSHGIIKLKLDKDGAASYNVEIIEEKDENGNSIPISKGFTVHGFRIDEEKQEAYIVVTNAQSWVNETTSVYVDKKWNDSKDHSYDSVIAYLNIVEGSTVRQIREITLSEANDWKYLWVNLPKTNPEGKPITYSVSESYFPGYSPKIEKLESGVEIGGWELVESYTFVDDETYILKTKNGYISSVSNTTNNLKLVDENTAKESDLAKWTVNVDGDNITFKNGNGKYLSYNHSSNKGTLQLSSTAKTFMIDQKSNGLVIYYEYKRFGKTTQYYLYEININGSTGSTTTSNTNALVIQPFVESEAITIDGVGYRVINTPLDQETSVTVTKEWEHPADNSIYYEQDKITVHLLANGERVGRIVVLSLKNNWTDTFKGLPYKDADGNVIEYTVEEGNNSIDWIPVYEPMKLIDGTTPTYQTTITNHYRWTGKVELPATGGLGYPIYILIGSLLIIGPFVYSFKMRKKHEGRSKK